MPIEPQLTGHLEGFALRFGGEVVGVFRTLREAIEALREASAARLRAGLLMTEAPQ